MVALPRRVSIDEPARAPLVEISGILHPMVGTQKVLVLLAHQQGWSHQSSSEIATIIRNANRWLEEASYGQASLDVYVTDWLNTGSTSPCNIPTRELLTRVDSQVDFNDGYRVVTVLRVGQGCGGSHIGYMGDPFLWQTDEGPVFMWLTVIERRMTVHLFMHELLHTYGMGHASTTNTPPETDGYPYSADKNEYGDSSSIMGLWNEGHISARQKELLGWMTIPEAGPGSYTLEDARSTSTALKSRRTLTDWFVLEWRDTLQVRTGQSLLCGLPPQIRIVGERTVEILPSDPDISPPVGIYTDTPDILEGVVRIGVSASDNRGIYAVQFRDSTNNWRVDRFSPPYEATLDTRQFPDGRFVYHASVIDNAGNKRIMGDQRKTIRNAPLPDPTQCTIPPMLACPAGDILYIGTIRDDEGQVMNGKAVDLQFYGGLKRCDGATWWGETWHTDSQGIFALSIEAGGIGRMMVQIDGELIAEVPVISADVDADLEVGLTDALEYAKGLIGMDEIVAFTRHMKEGHVCQ
jgi:hypothetical protein